MTGRDPALDNWIARGQAVRVVHALQARGHFRRLKRSGGELCGPCPVCGGHDRFGCHPARDVWNCRRCGVGGDAIALTMHCEGCDFLVAIEILTGEPPPGRVTGESDGERQAREARQAATIAAAREAEAAEALEQASYRQRERERAFELWQRGRGIAASPVEAYLRLRGLRAPTGAHLRFLDNHPLWSGPPPEGHILHRGPAMLAGITGPEGRFAGVHATWIDMAQPKGKALVADPKTGELLPAKKVRGSKRGGSIFLAGPAAGDATVLFIGEGIETVLSVRAAHERAEAEILATAEFRSSVDLGNLSGKAEGRVPHPTATLTDKNGRVRRQMVPDAEPKRDDRDPVVAIGAATSKIVLIGDGDSDSFTTRLALERAAARFVAAYPYVEVRLAMAPEGADFNDLWRREVAA